jgi:C4-dicarboxylate-specific signal transduction histidine kinase
VTERLAQILFLEPDADARRVIGRFLVRWGELRTVETLGEARDAIEQDGPEILIVDPDLGGGDVIELIMRLRGRVPWAQVLVITPAEMAEHTSAYIAAGANDVVTRPFDIGTLEGRILRLKEVLPVRKLEFERLQQLEARVRHVDAIAMLGTVAATIAHEIAGPLSAIMTNADMIGMVLADPAMTEEDRDNLLLSGREIMVAARVIQEFIARVRGTARRGEAVFVDESLASVFDTTRLFLKQKILFSRVALQWPEEGALPTLEHIPTRITQALTNAVANAMEAVGHGGHVTVRCEQSAEAVRIIVEDDGPGLSGDQLRSAVQPFYTTKPAGTGLGLSVISDVVREHGGALEFGTGIGGCGLGLRMVLPRSRYCSQSAAAARR